MFACVADQAFPHCKEAMMLGKFLKVEAPQFPGLPRQRTLGTLDFLDLFNILRRKLSRFIYYEC